MVYAKFEIEHFRRKMAELTRTAGETQDDRIRFERLMAAEALTEMVDALIEEGFASGESS